jgi:crotonobetainyl-CoA:carnitine CoA-transferase CaiB-like acyl-CoA transferase
MAFTGEPGRPPSRIGIPLADLSGGIFSCKGILAALYDRERTGKGRRVEVSMFDAMVNLLGYIGTLYLCSGELPRPQGTAHEFTVPWQAFKTQDGYVVIATRQEGFWRKLCTVLDEPALAEDPRYATNEQRLENRASLVPRLERILATRTTADWIERLYAAEVPAAPVNNLDGTFAEPPIAEHEMIVEYDHPQAGKVRLPGNPIKMSHMGKTISKPAPLLGEHTDAVLAKLLGLAPGQIAKLREQGAVR